MKLGWRYLLGVLAGAVYTFILFFFMAILTGGGHGFSVSIPVFLSPFAAIPEPRLDQPVYGLNPFAMLYLVTWPLACALIAGGHSKAARLWLSVHVVAIPFAIQRQLPDGMTLGSWFHSLNFQDDVAPFAAIIFSFHAICLVALWWLAPRCAPVLREL